jgi:hypothetical protein
MPAKRRTFHFILLLTQLGLEGCVAGDTQPKEQNSYQEFASEIPPCRLPTLSTDDVLAIAERALGEAYGGELEPPPNRRVRMFKCIYIYEQSIHLYDGKPMSLDAPDSTMGLWISRTGQYIFY